MKEGNIHGQNAMMESLRAPKTESKESSLLSTPEELNNKGVVSNQAVAEKLNAIGFTFNGKREIISGGFFGPILLLEVKGRDGQTEKIIEKSFARNKKTDPTRTLISESSVQSLSDSAEDIRPRLGLVDLETGGLKKVAIDWIYNEEKALQALQGLPGIPKLYGAVYEGKRGSVLEQYIDGFDMVDLFEQGHGLSDEEIELIFDRLEATYTAAAENGLVYNNPEGSTIMIDNESHQPFLMDWYNHATGSIKKDGPIKDKYLNGLKQIRELKKQILSAQQYEEKSAMAG